MVGEEAGDVPPVQGVVEVRPQHAGDWGIEVGAEPVGIGGEEVGRGDEHPAVDAGTGRLADEGVEIGLGDAVAGGVGLGLDGDGATVMRAGDGIDATVRSPPARPRRPRPDVRQFRCPEGMGAQQRDHEPLELPSPEDGIGIKDGEEGVRRGHWDGS